MKALHHRSAACKIQKSNKVVGSKTHSLPQIQLPLQEQEFIVNHGRRWC